VTTQILKSSASIESCSPPSAICGFATKFADPMPRYIYDVLRELGYAEGEFSYAGGARFVIGLIEKRKRLYRWLRQQWGFEEVR
jgi:hypothetical protein